MPAPTRAWIGTAAGSTTAASPVYPATGVTAGDSIYCYVVNDNSTAVATQPPLPAAPTGWTRLGSWWGGSGASGAGVGVRQGTLFKRDTLAAGTENGVTLTSAFANPTGSSFVYAVLLGIRPATPGNTISDLIGPFGSDTVSDVSFSVTLSGITNVQTNDLVLAMAAIPLSVSSSASAETIAITGCTIGTVTEDFDSSTTSGNDCRSFIWSAPVTAGSATTGAGTLAATLAAASTGFAGLWRVRDFSAAAPHYPGSRLLNPSVHHDTGMGATFP